MLKIPKALWLSLLILMFVYGCAGNEESPTAFASRTPKATSSTLLPESPTDTIMTPTPTSISTPERSSLITPEEYAVYDAMIESIFLPSGYEMIVMVDHTAADISAGPASQQDVDYLRENMEPILEPETLADFVAMNDRSYLIENHFSLDVPVVLLDNEAMEEFFAAEDGWERFYDQYPNSQGVITLSRVGFNTNNEQALVYVGNQADFLAGQGDYVLLTKEGGEWKIEKTVLAWIS